MKIHVLSSILALASICVATMAAAPPAMTDFIAPREAEAMMLAIQFSNDTVMHAADYADALRRSTTLPIDLIVASVLETRKNLSAAGVERALVIAHGCRGDAIQRNVVEILEDSSSPIRWRKWASSVLADWGDLNFIPILARCWRRTSEPAMRRALAYAFKGYGEFGRSYVREAAEEMTDRFDKLTMLTHLVVLNDPWAYAEFQKSKYDDPSDTLDLRRREAYWQRELRLRRFAEAKAGKAPAREPDENPLPPPGWKLPWKRE